MSAIVRRTNFSLLGRGHLVHLDHAPARRRQRRPLGTVGVGVLHGMAHLVALPPGRAAARASVVRRRPGPDDLVPRRHPLVEVGARLDAEVAVEGVVAQQRVDAHPLAPDLFDPRRHLLPLRPRDVDLGAPAEALEDDRQPAEAPRAGTSRSLSGWSRPPMALRCR